MREILEGIGETLGFGGLADEEFEIERAPTVTDSKFRVDEAATAVHLAGGLLVRGIWEKQTGQSQQIRVNTAHAALSLLSFLLQTQNGYPVAYPDTHRTWPYYPCMDAYRTRDERFVYLAAVYAHLRDGVLDLLESPNNAAAIARAVRRFDAEELERELNARELCGCTVRTYDEWRTHPQGASLADLPLVNVTKIGASAPSGLGGGAQPLSGVRVLDLTHVLAGPMATRELAAQGAEVLHISGPNVFELLPFALDTGHGKRNAFLDLKRAEDRDRLWELVEDADVYVDAYAPGKLAQFGCGVEDVVQRKAGIVCCTLSCYGTAGPWGRWGGFEQLGQAASGLMAGHSSVDAPQLVPAAVCDYLTGQLATIGMLAALRRRATEGGSYHVEVSLARTAMWLQSLGERADAERAGEFPTALLDTFLTNATTAFGTIRHLGPVVQYEHTLARFPHPVSALGSTLPHWEDHSA